MKTKELADWLQVSPTTIRNWSTEFSEFLTPSAQTDDGRRRFFEDHDARVLAYVAQLRTENSASDEIAANLRRLQLDDWQDLPPLPAIPPHIAPMQLMPRETHETAISTQRQSLLREIALLDDRATYLQTELTGERGSHSETRLALMDTVQQLGEAKGRLSAIDNERVMWHQYRRLLLTVAAVAVALAVAVVLLQLAP